MLEEVKNFAKRDAILCVDGQETLNYGRQTMPTFMPGHRLNSGPFGTMGVGLPFGVGAKVACPDKQVIVVHGDGSMGMNAMEIDTAVRHKIPILIVISLNGGWTGDPKREKPGRDLGYVRLRQDVRGAGRLRRIRHQGRRISVRRWNARRRRWMRAWWRWSTCAPTIARGLPGRRSPTTRPEHGGLWVCRVDASEGGSQQI